MLPTLSTSDGRISGTAPNAPGLVLRPIGNTVEKVRGQLAKGKCSLSYKVTKLTKTIVKDVSTPALVEE